MKNIISKEFINIVIRAAIISTVANVVLLAIARPIAQAPQSFSPFYYWSVIELTILGVFAAGFVYAGIKRFFPTTYNKIFIWTSVIALLISLVPDAMLPFSPDSDNQGATTFIVIILMLMHILTAGIVMLLFTKKAKIHNTHH